MVKKISRLLQAGSIFSLVLLHFTFVSCKSLSGKFSGTKVWGDEDGPNMPPPPPPPTPPITPNAQTSSSTSASTFSPTTEPYRVRVLNVIFKLPSDENRSTHPAETLINELKLELEKASSKNGITQMNDGNWYLYHTQEVIFDFAPYIYLNALPIPEKDPSDPTKFNYTQFIQDQGLCRNIKNTFDEIWLWANDTAGFYESRMVGPSGTVYFVNSAPIQNNACKKTICIYGF